MCGDCQACAVTGAHSTALHACVLVLAGKLLRLLVGHEDRLARMAFHPMGRHLVRDHGMRTG